MTQRIIVSVLFSLMLYTQCNKFHIKSIPDDYCNKIDTLINERNLMFKKYPGNFDRILKEIEIKSKITGTYKFGFGGRTYCDTFFNNDVRRWANYFGCNNPVNLKPADTIITPWCDTTGFKMD